MKLKHLNIKPKLFPVPSSGMASSTSPLTSSKKKKKNKKGGWPLENGVSQTQRTMFNVLVQNGLVDWMVSEKACCGSQHESPKVNKCNENGRHFSWRQKKRKIFWYSYDRAYMTICEIGGNFFFPSYFGNAIATNPFYFVFFFFLRNDMWTWFLQYFYNKF